MAPGSDTAPESGTLRVGAATVDITPTDIRGTFMAGFGMGRRATGVHMPLEANAVYLAAGEGTVVLVSLDLVGLLKVWCDRIRAAVTEVAGDAVVIACTHTHAGPDTLGYWGPSIAKVFPRSDGKNPAYMHWLVDRVAQCVDEAVRSARDATMTAASFDADPAVTRNDRKGGGRYDHAVALAFDDTRGRRIAMLLNYASHPEGLWEHNTLLSPDYVGPLRQALCAEAPHEGDPAAVPRVNRCPVVFLSGPLGAMLTINVEEAPKDVPARQLAIATLAGILAADALRALESAEPCVVAEVEHRRTPVTLASRNWRYRLLERLGFVDVVTKNKAVTSLVHGVCLGPVAIVTAPGELCPELGARIREGMPGEHRIVVSLAEDEFGYMLEPDMFDDKEYGYEQSMSLGRGTADSLFEAFAAVGFTGLPAAEASESASE